MQNLDETREVMLLLSEGEVGCLIKGGEEVRGDTCEVSSVEIGVERGVRGREEIAGLFVIEGEGWVVLEVRGGRVMFEVKVLEQGVKGVEPFLHEQGVCRRSGRCEWCVSLWVEELPLDGSRGVRRGEGGVRGEVEESGEAGWVMIHGVAPVGSDMSSTCVKTAAWCVLEERVLRQECADR